MQDATQEVISRIINSGRSKIGPQITEMEEIIAHSDVPQEAKKSLSESKKEIESFLQDPPKTDNEFDLKARNMVNKLHKTEKQFLKINNRHISKKLVLKIGAVLAIVSVLITTISLSINYHLHKYRNGGKVNRRNSKSINTTK